MTTLSDEETSEIRLGVWGTLGEPRLSAALEHTGCDWVCLDAQHGHFDDRAVRETLALRQRKVPTVVRLAANDVTLIGRALDAGADGIIAPLVQDSADAENAVRAAHYPARGIRSFGPIHGADYGTESGLPGRPFVAVMVETQRALDDVDAIAATPDLDMIFVGPFDLSLALGRDVDDTLGDTAPDAPLPRVVRACRNAGIIPGAYAGEPSRVPALRGHGFEWIAAVTDVGLLRSGAEAVRSLVG